eukprot:1529757-Pyramimonas_sp.AAC.1
MPASKKNAAAPGSLRNPRASRPQRARTSGSCLTAWPEGHRQGSSRGSTTELICPRLDFPCRIHGQF